MLNSSKKMRNRNGNSFYQHEKVPLMFQSDTLSTKLVEIRNRIESNINEAAYVAERHQTQMGVLGQARRNAQFKI